MRFSFSIFIFAITMAGFTFADPGKKNLTGTAQTLELKVNGADGGSSAGTQLNGAGKTPPKVVVPTFSTHSKAFQLQQSISGDGLRFAVGVGDMQDVDQVMKANEERLKKGLQPYVIFVSGKTVSEKTGTPDTAFFEAEDAVRLTEQVLDKYKDAVVVTDFDSGFRNKDVAVDAAKRIARAGAAAILFDNQNDLHRKAATGTGVQPMDLDDYLTIFEAVQTALKKGNHDLLVIARGANDTKEGGYEFADAAAGKGAGSLLLHSTMRNLDDMNEMKRRYPDVPRMIIQLDKGDNFHSVADLKKNGVNLVFAPDLIQKSAKEGQVAALEELPERTKEDSAREVSAHIPVLETKFSQNPGAEEFHKALHDHRPTYAIGVADVQDADQVMKVNEKRVAEGKQPYVIFVSGKTYSEKIGQPDHAFYRARDAIRITEQIREKHPDARIFVDVDAGFGNTNTATQALLRLAEIADGVLWDNQSDLHRVAATGGGVRAISNEEYFTMMDGVQTELRNKGKQLLIFARGANSSQSEGIDFANRAIQTDSVGGVLLHSTMRDLGKMGEMNAHLPKVPTAVIQLDKGDFHSQAKLQDAGVNLAILSDVIQERAKKEQFNALMAHPDRVGETPANRKTIKSVNDCDLELGFVLSNN